MTSRTFTFSVIAPPPPPSGTSPVWFNELVHGKWRAVGENSLETAYNAAVANGDWGIVDGVANGPPHGSDKDTMVKSESGACVDPVTGEVMLVGNGGHNDGYENCGWVLNLRSGSQLPSWRLMNRWTPEFRNTPLYTSTVVPGSMSYQPFYRGSAVAVSAIDTSTGRVTFASPHGIDAGDYVYFESIGGTTQLNGIWWKTSSSSTKHSTTFCTLIEHYDGTAINLASLSAFTSGGTGRACFNTVQFDVAGVTEPSNTWNQTESDEAKAFVAWRSGSVLNPSGAAVTLSRILGHTLVGGNARLQVVKQSDRSADRPLPGNNDPLHILKLFVDESHDNPDSRTPSTYQDGRPRAMHTTYQQHYHNGRVWFGFQNSISSGQGQSALGLVSFDAALCRAYLASTGLPYPWEESSLGPWRIHTAANPAVGGTVAGSVPFTTSLSLNNIIFEPTQLDRSTGLVWQIMQGTSKTFWSIDTNQDGKCTLYTFAAAPVNTGENKGMWSALVPNADPVTGGAVMIFGSKNTHDVGILYVTRAALAADSAAVPLEVNLKKTKSKVTTTGGSTMNWGGGVGAGFRDEWGAVYHAKSRAILAMKNDQTFFLGQGVVRKLALAFDGNGHLDETQPWVWSEVVINTDGTAPPQFDADKGNFSKWNIIENFDGSSDALILVNNDSASPTYVCKLSQAV